MNKLLQELQQWLEDRLLTLNSCECCGGIEITKGKDHSSGKTFIPRKNLSDIYQIGYDGLETEESRKAKR